MPNDKKDIRAESKPNYQNDEVGKLISKIEEILQTGTLVELPIEELVPDMARRYFESENNKQTSQNQRYRINIIRRYNPKTENFDRYAQITNKDLMR